MSYCEHQKYCKNIVKCNAMIDTNENIIESMVFIPVCFEEINKVKEVENE